MGDKTLENPQKNLYGLTPSENTVDRLIVHGGLMHADDVLCAAIAKMINPDVQINRAFKVPDESELAAGTLVADIGRGEFDHHQKEVKAQPNGHKHASIGLVLENSDIKNALKEKGFDLDLPKHSEFFKEIGQIEDLDNGLVGTEAHAISDFCAYMNPVWDSKEKPDDRFMAAVEMVQHHFVEPYLEHGYWPEKDQEVIKEHFKELEKESLAAEKRAEEVVLPALEKMENNTVILPQFAPWDKQLVPSEAEFVIYPSNRGGFNLQCVPPELGSFEKKVELPDWSENMPQGCTFEHPGKFLASFETLEDAKNAAYQVVAERDEKNKAVEKALNDKIKIMQQALAENEPVWAAKAGGVIMEEIEPGTELTTYTKNGNTEVEKEVAKEGQVLVTRADDNGQPVVDEFGHTNQWFMGREKFEKRYNEPDERGFARPAGVPQKFVELSQDTTLMVPWGENGSLVPQEIKAGGFINITDPSDIYGIAKEEFQETYKETVEISFAITIDKEQSEKIDEYVSHRLGEELNGAVGGLQVEPVKNLPNSQQAIFTVSGHFDCANIGAVRDQVSRLMGDVGATAYEVDYSTSDQCFRETSENVYENGVISADTIAECKYSSKDLGTPEKSLKQNKDSLSL